MRNVVLMLLLEPQPGVIDDHRKAMVKTICDIVPGLAVPKSHNQHVNDVADIGRGRPTLENVMLHAEEDQPHENVITEPK